MQVLIVEDEVRLADALAQMLKQHQYLVETANNASLGRLLAESGNYDLIILDRALPDGEGVSILRHIRFKGVSSPVLLLTAKDTVPNKIEGLDAGADDYMVKPFAMEELLARVRALGRRPEPFMAEANLQAGLLLLNLRRNEATINRRKIKLSTKETRLLALLIKNRNRVLTKEQIFDRVWGNEKDVEIELVELYIHYLRKKIDFKSVNTAIQTIRGIGYCLKEDVID